MGKRAREFSMDRHVHPVSSVLGLRVLGNFRNFKLGTKFRILSSKLIMPLGEIGYWQYNLITCNFDVLTVRDKDIDGFFKILPLGQPEFDLTAYENHV